MDPKMLNYSKLQIPILSGSHTYVIMPALLSQIDTLPLINALDDMTSLLPHQQHHQHQPTKYFSSAYASSSSLQNQNSNSNYTNINVTSDTESTLNSDSVLTEKEFQEKFGINFSQFESVTSHNVDDTQHEEDREPQSRVLNSPTHSITKFLYKETENIDNLCNTMINDKETTNKTEFDDCEMINIDKRVQDETTSELNMNNLINLSHETTIQSNESNPNGSVVVEQEEEEEESDTLVLKIRNDNDLNINSMINCFVSLDKIDENKFGDIKFKCSVCHGFFNAFNDLVNHKDNQICKELNDYLRNPDDLSEDEKDEEEVERRSSEDSASDNDDIDMDIDEPEVQEPLVKDRPRRKYTKNKSKMNTNLICEHCNKMCRTKAELMVHLHKHNGNPPDCWICAKTCASFSNLVSHVQLHTSEKPYACQFCGKHFTQDAHLTRHLRLHTGERPFVCKLCGKTYKDYSYYKTHERIHRGERLYKCKFCNKEYYDASYYKKHIRLHTGEKPYMCTVCGKQFHRSDYLKLHSYQHTDERPFYCHVCGKGFKMNYNLKIHLKNHENEELQTPIEVNEESSSQQDLSELNSLIVVDQCQANYTSSTLPTTFSFNITRVENSNTHFS